MSSAYLVLNAGSSSLKFAVFRVGSRPSRIVSGSLSRMGERRAQATVKADGDPRLFQGVVRFGTPTENLALILRKVRPHLGATEIAGVGHRFVHGGPRFGTPQRVTGLLLEELQRLRNLDPEHAPAEIGLLLAARRQLPQIPHVACFDTSFHRHIPRHAYLLPIPRKFERDGLRRYGFHGLSYGYVMRELRRIGVPAAKKGRMILAHLGSGASLAAIKDGKCIDTSMGFTPTGGLPMGRRSGDLDPGIVVHLSNLTGLQGRKLNHLFAAESGLLGISGISADMRELLDRSGRDSRAAEAVGHFCYQTTKWIGGYAAALGGLDVIVFTGGIGENAPAIRRRICAGLGFLGVAIDKERNQMNAPVISASRSAVDVRMIHTDEEIMIALAMRRVLGSH